jgi:ubiquitin fusion degradation protein 1
LTKDDVISIFYNDKEYQIRVLETRPGNAVSIIECDMDVDFAPPLGYVEPTYSKNIKKEGDLPETTKKYPSKKEAQVGGEGYRLDGKAKKPEQLISQSTSNNHQKEQKNKTDEEEQKRGIPNYDYVIGTLTFNRNLTKKEVSSYLKTKSFH